MYATLPRMQRVKLHELSDLKGPEHIINDKKTAFGNKEHTTD